MGCALYSTELTADYVADDTGYGQVLAQSKFSHQQLNYAS